MSKHGPEDEMEDVLFRDDDVEMLVDVVDDDDVVVPVKTKKAKKVKKVAKAVKVKKVAKTAKPVKPTKPSKPSKPKVAKVAKATKPEPAKRGRKPLPLPPGLAAPTLKGKPLKSSWKSHIHLRTKHDKKASVLCQNNTKSPIWKRDLVSVPPNQTDRVTCGRCRIILRASS